MNLTRSLSDAQTRILLNRWMPYFEDRKEVLKQIEECLAHPRATRGFDLLLSGVNLWMRRRCIELYDKESLVNWVNDLFFHRDQLTAKDQFLMETFLKVYRAYTPPPDGADQHAHRRAHVLSLAQQYNSDEEVIGFLTAYSLILIGNYLSNTLTSALYDDGETNINSMFTKPSDDDIEEALSNYRKRRAKLRATRSETLAWPSHKP